MTQRNKYARGSKISDAKFRMMVQLFAKDASAVEIAEQTGLNRNSVNRYTLELRKRIIERFSKPVLQEFINLLTEEAWQYFGILVDNGKIYAEPINNEHNERIRMLLTGALNTGLDENTRRWREYDGLLSSGYSMQVYLNFGKTVRTAQPENITTAEDFFIYVKERMSKFYGISKRHFFIHLKECEFRYNYRADNIYNLILSMVEEKPLFSDE